jgi:CheY-like chemotaxis protein
VDVVRVVADALEVVRPAAEAKNVDIAVVEQPAHAALIGEPRRLQQIVWNLLSNAVKFTPAGGHVSIIIAQRHNRCIVEVRDSGIGIEKSFLPHLFERFTQADTSTTREYQGVGLGLAIARQLVELHGGTVSAHSEGPGKGAAFIVTLPVRTTAEVPADTRMPRWPTAPAVDLHGIRVLVVDDDLDAREALALMLARSGASVTTAGSADEAFDELTAGSFDVFLSDLAMPSRDGYDLIQRVRGAEDERVRRTPAIAVSAFAREEERTKAIASGFHIHVAKPVAPEELVGAVSALLSR